MDLRTEIYKEFDEAIGELIKSLSDGHYTYEEYKMACGQIKGLHLAFDMIKEIYRKYLEK